MLSIERSLHILQTITKSSEEFEFSLWRKTIMLHPLVFCIMQTMDAEQKKSVMVSAEVHQRIAALRKGDQTYGDVVASSIQALEELVFAYGGMGTLSVELTSLGRYTIHKPIQFQLSYDIENAVWCLKNDELALNGYGSTYQRTIECLEECVEGHVLFFTEFPDSKHTDDGLRIKSKLQEYIDFDQVLSYFHERDEKMILPVLQSEKDFARSEAVITSITDMKHPGVG